MRAVDVRQLGAAAGRIVRQVSESGEGVDVTYRGRVVARLVPVAGRRVSRRAAPVVWSDLDRLAAEIGARWPGHVTAAEAVREGRRQW
jgi:antitoxin (DNA-binding transcriptional repressor) of toxin-antitoxin stability system